MPFTDIPDLDLSNGIDARSSESQIAPGYSEDILNFDVVDKRLVKRKGFRAYFGMLPIRLTKVQFDATNQRITFTLPFGIDLTTARSNPIVVYGKTNSTGAGDFTSSNQGQYYPVSTSKTPTELDYLQTSLIVPEDERPFTGDLLAVGVSLADSLTNLSNTQIQLSSYTIDQITNDLTLNYNLTQSELVHIYYADMTAIGGTTYVDSSLILNGTDPSITITAGTHGLTSLVDILNFCWLDTGSEWEQILPNSVSINGSGDVTLSFQGTFPAQTLRVILTKSNAGDTTVVSVPGSTTYSYPIATDLPFNFFQVYEISGSTYSQVLIDSIEYDAGTGQTTLTWDNGNPAAANFAVRWIPAEQSINQLIVTPNNTITTSSVDTNPQLTLWGFRQTEALFGGSKSAREGWANHIDSYKVELVNDLVAGLGGMLYKATSQNQADPGYLIPEFFARLRATTDQSRVIGPAFWDSGELPARSGGYITGDNGGTNWFTISQATYNSGTGYVDFLISVPNKQVLDSTGSPTTIGNVLSVNDILTVQKMGYSRLNGDFSIKAISEPSASTIQLSVQIDSISSSDYNDLNTAGLGGVFSDKLTTTSPSEFLPGDRLLSDFFTDNNSLIRVTNVTGTDIYISGVTAIYQVPIGLRFGGQRESDVLPLRLLDGTTSSQNLVKWDTVSYQGAEYSVLDINTNANESVTLADDGTELVITVASTQVWNVGSKVVIARAGTILSGEHLVTEIRSLTELVCESTGETATGSGILIGETCTLDKAIQFQEDYTNTQDITVEGRWLPIEAPTSQYDLPISFYSQYFKSGEYTNKPFIRSVMSTDNMYLTNGQDEVLKFDGENLYRAGLFRWQPGLFTAFDTGASAKIIIKNPITTAVSQVSGNKFTVGAQEADNYSVGDRIYHTQNGAYYTITQINAAAHHIFVDNTITGTNSGDLVKASVFNYYFKLICVDANNNLISSAATGVGGFRVELGISAAIRLRLVGMPAWDNYDYDRIKLEIYRTSANQSTVYRRIDLLDVSFDNTNGYIDYTDTTSDDAWATLPGSIPDSTLLGVELGTGWSDPLRAKYVTSAYNTLILGNLSDYPELNIETHGSGSNTLSNYTGTKWTFKRNTSNPTTISTDMINTAVYQMLDGSTSQTVSTTSAGNTITYTATGIDLTGTLSTGDWIYAFHKSAPTSADRLEASGLYQIASVVLNGADTEINVTVDGVGTLSGNLATDLLWAVDPSDIPVYIGNLDGNRLAVNSNDDLFIKSRVLNRLAEAINSSMRMVDVSLPGFTEFVPWLIANAGPEYNAGQLVIKQPKIDSAINEGEAFEFVLPQFSGFRIFVNDIEYASSTLPSGPFSEVSAIVKLYPSRLIVSYPNYPETFDSPTADLPAFSDSVIDVNSADGQQITGIIPFFGDSAFGAAAQGGVVIVFKEHSIYLVDITRKAQGARAGEANPVQKIESQGLGCTAPGSIAVTKQGIIFGNNSGLYRLTRSLTIEYIGMRMERFWQEQVNKDYLNIVQATHFSIGSQYKVSVPMQEESENSGVFVYNHALEGQDRSGAWSRYDGHNATGWANLGSNAYFANTNSGVNKLRQTDTNADFRDLNASIPAVWLSRAYDFGLSGTRKLIRAATVIFRAVGEATSVINKLILDLNGQEFELDPTQVNVTTVNNDLSDRVQQKATYIQTKFRRAAGNSAQYKIEHNELEQPLQVAGISWLVDSAGPEGQKQAPDTTGPNKA